MFGPSSFWGDQDKDQNKQTEQATNMLREYKNLCTYFSDIQRHEQFRKRLSAPTFKKPLKAIHDYIELKKIKKNTLTPLIEKLIDMIENNIVMRVACSYKNIYCQGDALSLITTYAYKAPIGCSVGNNFVYDDECDGNYYQLNIQMTELIVAYNFLLKLDAFKSKNSHGNAENTFKRTLTEQALQLLKTARKEYSGSPGYSTTIEEKFQSLLQAFGNKTKDTYYSPNTTQSTQPNAQQQHQIEQQLDKFDKELSESFRKGGFVFSNS